jgi:hypothetical protein
MSVNRTFQRLRRSTAAQIQYLTLEVAAQEGGVKLPIAFKIDRHPPLYEADLFAPSIGPSLACGCLGAVTLLTHCLS